METKGSLISLSFKSYATSGSPSPRTTRDIKEAMLFLGTRRTHKEGVPTTDWGLTASKTMSPLQEGRPLEKWVSQAPKGTQCLQTNDGWNTGELMVSEASYHPPNHLTITPGEPRVTLDMTGKPITLLLDTGLLALLTHSPGPLSPKTCLITMPFL